MRQRIQMWDFLKFILIFSVVLGHVIAKFITNSKLLEVIYIYIYSFHMPLFIFILGYFSKNLSKEKIIRRLLEYILLFVVAKLIRIGNLLFFYNRMLIEIKNLSAWPWFLFATGIFILLSFLLNNISKIKVLVTSIVVSLLAGYFSFINEDYSISRIIVFFPFYYLGICCDESIIIRLRNNKYLFKFGVIFLLTLFLVCVYSIPYSEEILVILKGKSSYIDLKSLYYLGPIFRTIHYSISLIAMISVIVILPNKLLNKYFIFLGQNTLTIYLFHIFIFNVLLKYNIDLIFTGLGLPIEGTVLIITLIVICVSSTWPFISVVKNIKNFSLYLYNRLPE